MLIIHHNYARRYYIDIIDFNYCGNTVEIVDNPYGETFITCTGNININITQHRKVWVNSKLVYFASDRHEPIPAIPVMSQGGDYVRLNITQHVNYAVCYSYKAQFYSADIVINNSEIFICEMLGGGGLKIGSCCKIVDIKVFETLITIPSNVTKLYLRDKNSCGGGVGGSKGSDILILPRTLKLSINIGYTRFMGDLSFMQNAESGTLLPWITTLNKHPQIELFILNTITKYLKWMPKNAKLILGYCTSDSIIETSGISNLSIDITSGRKPYEFVGIVGKLMIYSPWGHSDIKCSNLTVKDSIKFYCKDLSMLDIFAQQRSKATITCEDLKVNYGLIK